MEKNLTAEIIKKYGLVMALSLVMLLSVVDIFFVSVSRPKIEQGMKVETRTVCRSSEGESLGNIPKISEIKGPMISEKAAFSACQTKNIPACRDLGSSVWVFLLISYIALLIFNLGYGFAKGEKIQWVWESILTGTFLSFWFVFDTCSQSLWYPLYVAKLAIAIYVIYLFFFLRRKDSGYTV